MRFMKAFLVSCLMLMSLLIFARAVDSGDGSKKMDLTKYHNIGNIWLRVSNYGFFGSGNDIQPPWPSLEYPGGSGIDYLYQGSLWFGAKKHRRDAAGNLYYWKNYPPTVDDHEITIHVDSVQSAEAHLVLDTLVTVGFDGDKDLYEFLPAYNPLESSQESVPYDLNQQYDVVATASIRDQRRGVDDDGDGRIDEDPVGYSFPFRKGSELPSVFDELGSHDLFYDPGSDKYTIIGDNINIWFPLGFHDLSYIPEETSGIDYNFTKSKNDDNDNFTDEDGYPVSEQDYIGYYYDYSPFGTPGERESGGSKTSSHHVPLNVSVRQMSYQWSFGYIKNLVYIEFDITNMNEEDILYDCTMGIYLDADVGPQAWDSSEKAGDDISSYDQELEFAYTYDADKDKGLTPGYIGARVVTPNPDSLEYACWTWKVGDGPDDFDPLDFPNNGTSNEKYYLLSGRNPNADKYTSLRDYPNYQEENNENGCDTRFLFAFYGKNDDDFNGATNPDDERVWNLKPHNTMKIVVAVFPGEDLQELKRTANWAKDIYGESQTLTTVVKPDTFPHYNPPEPPMNPKSYVEMLEDGNKFRVYWDNRSEFTYDLLTVAEKFVGWQSSNTELDSYKDGDYEGFPEEFLPENYNNGEEVDNALVNPWTAYRLRHDFQGYKLWGRSGSGKSLDWDLKNEWAKVETAKDLEDYDVNSGTNFFMDFGGYISNDNGLPNSTVIDDINISEWKDYYQYNDIYEFESIKSLYNSGKLINNTVYGYPLYNTDYITWDELESKVVEANNSLDTEENLIKEALWFKNPNISDELYLALYDDSVIPLPSHSGQTAVLSNDMIAVDQEKLEEMTKKRLAGRYYEADILYPPRGVEYYIAINTFDRGMPSQELLFLESGRDENMKVFFPGTLAKDNIDNVYVVPNPYLGLSKFDGRKANDNKGDKSRRIWFANLPEECTIRVYTLAGDLVDEIKHNGTTSQEIINISKAAETGLQASGIEPWDMLSRNNQIISSGVYLFSVENNSGDIKVGKFVIIK